MLEVELDPRRVDRITGSRLPKVLGISPYGTPDSVMREMVRQHFAESQEFTGNIATRWGSNHEADAIEAWENKKVTFAYSCQEFFIHPVHDFFAVTVDGLGGSGDEKRVVEVKAPYAGGWTHWKERPDYEAQVRLQMECVGCDLGDLVAWRETGTSISTIERDPDWLPSVLPRVQDFMEQYHETLIDPVLYQPLLEPQKDERDDPEWQLAAQSFLEAKADAERAAASLAQARDRMLTLAPGKSAFGSGVRVTRYPAKGNIDWKKFAAIHARGINPEWYRKPPSSRALVDRL